MQMKYTPTIREIADAQRSHQTFKDYFMPGTMIKKRVKCISLKVVDGIDIIVYNDTRLVILTLELQSQIIQWYHHYLQHPRETCLKMTLKTIMYWKGMTSQLRKYVKLWDSIQKGKQHRV